MSTPGLVDRFGRWATLEWRDVEALDRLFGKYGQIVVFVFRFMPAFRTMISLPAVRRGARVSPALATLRARA